MKMIYKLMIKWYLSTESSLPVWLRKKADSDSDLAVFLKGEREFNGLLTRSIDRNVRLNDGNRANAILKAIDDSSNEESESVVIDFRNDFRPLVVSVGAIAAMLVLTLTLWNGDDLRDVENVQDIQIAQVEPTVKTIQIAEIASWKNPLDQEIEYVVNDAKVALLFLANNFLPDDYVNTLDGSSSSS